MNGSAGGWPALERELDAWRAAGREATLWWRDDDAIAPTPAFERLCDLTRRVRVPLAVAVVPAEAGPALAARIAAEAGRLMPLQHGYAHANHAGPRARKAELGDHRPVERVLRELARGRKRMTALFGGTSLPVLVPPWNRIAPALVTRLPRLGFRGLSRDRPRRTAEPAPGLREVNCHVDIMHWPAPRGFLGESACLALLADHLRARREGRADAQEPSGILSHHPAHDAPAWSFLEALLMRLRDHRAVRFLAPAEVFPARAGRTRKRGAA